MFYDIPSSSQFLCSLALNRCKEFLTSDLLYAMYSDALSGIGSNNAEFSFALMKEPESFSKTQSSSFKPVHFSRHDAFIKVMQALTEAVCRSGFMLVS